MFGSEKALQKKKDNVILHNQSLNTSLEAGREFSNSRQENYNQSLSREKAKSVNIFTKNAKKAIQPIEEFKKLEDIVTPMIIDKTKSNKNQQRIKIIKNNEFDVLNEGSELLKNYLTQIKSEALNKSSEKKTKLKPKLSDSIEFAIVNNDIRNSVNDEEKLFYLKTQKNKIGSYNNQEKKY